MGRTDADLTYMVIFAGFVLRVLQCTQMLLL